MLNILAGDLLEAFIIKASPFSMQQHYAYIINTFNERNVRQLTFMVLGSRSQFHAPVAVHIVVMISITTTSKHTNKLEHKARVCVIMYKIMFKSVYSGVNVAPNLEIRNIVGGVLISCRRGLRRLF